MSTTLKHCCDVGFLMGAIGSIAGYLPGVLASLASIGAIVWYGIQIYDWYNKR